jgi:hypothetical protein
MHCYFCDQTSPEGSLFCKPCGSPFHLAPCPRCAAVNDLKVVSCYKCKAILPIRRAEANELASSNVVSQAKNAEPVIERKSDKAVSEPAAAVPAREVASAQESTPPVLIEDAPAPSTAISVAANAEEALVDRAAPADIDVDAGVDAGVDTNDDSYQKTIVLQRAMVNVPEVGYQKTIPVRRPLEKVHDEDYQKTIALQRASADALQHPPTDLYDANYQKTIALQRTLHPAPAEVHESAYIKTVSLRHPPASLVGGTAPHVVAAEANSLGSAISADLQADRARLPIDLVQKAKWGQRALLALFALLLIVAAAYFFLRSQSPGVVPTASSDAEPAQLQTEALSRIPAAPASKVVDPLPLNVRVDATKQAQNKAVVQRPPVAKTPQPLPAKQAVAPTQAKPQTKAAPTGQVLYLPPGATSASAAATAAAIADAIGKAPIPQPTSRAPTVENVPTRDAPLVKGAVNSGAASSPPVPCTEALAALGLCVIQAAPQPKQ